MNHDALDLKLSADIELPLEAVTQKFAFLGISGSGKTYGAGRFVEGLLEAKAQVVVIDTVGNWFGLRLAADGKSPGFQIPILGGARGDVPIESTHGKLVAETIVESRSSMIVCISEFTQGEIRRFVIDFATTLLKLAQQHPAPLHVVWEECQDIVPQRVGGEDAKMVGAVEKLIKKGRNYGVGSTLISQRSAAVNKDVLNQIETLFCFRTGGPQDRKAIADWIAAQDAELDWKAIKDQLPKLATGTCFCWSPHWLGVLDRISISRKKTFDASATPKFGKANKAAKLAPVDLEKFKASMNDAVEKAKANDPEVLRARIRELEKQIKAPGAKPERAMSTDDWKRLERVVERLSAVQGEVSKDVAGIGEHVAAFDKQRDRLAQAQQVVTTELGNVRALIGRKDGNAAAVSRPPSPVRAPAKPSTKASSHDSSDLPRGEATTLGALIQYPNGLRREQLTVLTGYKRSTRDTYIARLRERGFATTADDRVFATSTGAAALTSYEPLPTGEALQEWWFARLPAGERAVLKLLIGAYPSAVERADIDELTGFKRSTRDTYLSRMTAKQLVEEAGRGAVRASATLFEAS